MEYTQWELKSLSSRIPDVLILVVMEYTQWGVYKQYGDEMLKS